MRKLLSPAACWSYTPPVGGGARLSPYLLPPPLFLGFSLRPIHGAGALPQFRPSPSFPLFGGERW
jgi:hypothetical protein